MEVAGFVVGAALVGAFTVWGFIAPAIDLRRSGELRAQTLLASYRRHVTVIPRAVVRHEDAAEMRWARAMPHSRRSGV